MILCTSLKIMDNNIKSQEIKSQDKEYENSLKKDIESNEIFEELSPKSLRLARIKRFENKTLTNQELDESK